jgi:alkanesulfonate monooxygenase
LIGGYVEAVLKRAGEKGDGWLTYFYQPEGFVRGWKKVCDYAKAAGRDLGQLQSTNQLPIMVGPSREAVKPKMMEWLSSEWDIASWSDSTPESAIVGTVDDCLAQLREHVAAGVDRIIFVPYRYEKEQIEIIAREIVPKLGK